MLIAIDGPAGSGKSTAAKAVATRLGFVYLDTGAMYRCVALKTLSEDVEPPEAARDIQIALGETISLDGRDVTAEIRTPEVSARASEVAAMPSVRTALVERQRELTAAGNYVAEGRDIGTVVAPNAEVKIFLTASPEERARRRAKELGLSEAEVLADQQQRDQRDESREHSPLRPADDATLLDTTGLTFEQVVDRIVELAKKANVLSSA